VADRSSGLSLSNEEGSGIDEENTGAIMNKGIVKNEFIKVR